MPDDYSVHDVSHGRFPGTLGHPEGSGLSTGWTSGKKHDRWGVDPDMGVLSGGYLGDAGELGDAELLTTERRVDTGGGEQLTGPVSRAGPTGQGGPEGLASLGEGG